MWAFTESIIFAAEGVNTARGIKTWHTDMKWANGVGNMEPKDLLEARLTDTNFQFGKEKEQRKEKQYLWNTIKQRATEWSVPVTVKGSFPSQALSLNYAAHHVRTWSLVTITTASSSPPCTQLIITSHRKTYAFPRPTTTLHQGIHIWLLSCHHFLYMTAASRLYNFMVSA